MVDTCEGLGTRLRNIENGTQPGQVHFDEFDVIVNAPGYQTIRNYAVPAFSVIRIDISVACNQVDSGNRATFTRTGLFYRTSSSVQIQDVTWQHSVTFRSDKNMDIRFVLGSSSIAIQVRNAGSIDTRWVGFMDRILVL